MEHAELNAKAPTHYEHARPILITPPTTTPLPNSYTQTQLHSHLPTRQSRGRTKPRVLSTLKSIICKDWPALIQETSPLESEDPIRRPAMRMKDSDDYITARAANPRTGLISPSVGTRTPCTPDSPGDALKLRSVHQLSPTPELRTRPPISRANEGRKLSGGRVRKWSANEDGCYIESLGSSPAHRSPKEDRQARPSSSCSSHLKDDEFVVHMPSAREPQPFAYPGYSAEQIEAYEHYRDKSRRVSSEGYDQRLIHASHGSRKRPSTPVPTEQPPSSDETAEGLVVCPNTGQYFRAYRDISNNCDMSEPPNITVRKRSVKADKVQQGDKGDVHALVDKTKHTLSGAKSGVLSAPFTSPKKPDSHACSSQCPNDVPISVPEAYRNTKHAQICSATGAISGKTAHGSAPRRNNVANGDHYYELVDCKIKKKSPRRPPDSDSSSSAIDLRKLPRVRLVSPECAALPHHDHCHRPRHSHGELGDRQCSFECERKTSDGECVERRMPSSGTVRRTSPFEVESSPATPSPSEKEQATAATTNPTSHAEIALGVLEALLSYMTRIKIPKSGQIELLMSQDAPTQERVEALKALVSLAAHALAVCTTLAMLWKLGSAVMHLLEVLLWPLAVPFKVLRWIARGG